MRQVTQLFEQAGVTRTERSIINWCRPNRQGVARLDAFFDENEGRYYITSQSVTRAIEEERAKQPAGSATPVPETEVPKRSELSLQTDTANDERMKELELRNRDLEIATRAKDQVLALYEKEHGQFMEKLIGISRYVGELETQVLQLGGTPREDRTLPHDRNQFDSR